MANVDRPNGFRPVGTISGAPWQGAITKCYSDADNLFMGDVVIKNTAAQADPKSGGGYLAVDRATSTTATIALGVVVGWEPNPTALGNLYHTASTTYAVYVCTAPDAIYRVQGDGAGTLADATSVGLNTDLVIAAGSTTTGASNMEIDEDTTAFATTADTPVKVIGVVNEPNNTAGTANCDWLVIFNKHSLKSDTGETAGL